MAGGSDPGIKTAGGALSGFAAFSGIDATFSRCASNV
jgi:hypothetical protein